MPIESPNRYFDGEKLLVLHKSPLVELVASLHGLTAANLDKNDSLWLAAGRFKKLDATVRKSLEMYGFAYANWLLIMDLATYATSRVYSKTGRAEVTFEETMAELRRADDATYLYFFLGMPAFNLKLEDAQKWLDDPDSIDKRSLKLIGQYISSKNVMIFIRNIKSLREDIDGIIRYYWSHAFKDIWGEIEPNITKAIRANKFECQSQGSVIQYVSNLHNDIFVTKGQIFLRKDVAYIIPIDEIEEVHVYPSTFSSPELLMDKYGSNLVIYFNINLSQINSEEETPAELVNTIKALSDSNRIKMLKILWGAPSTTQYLSKAMGLAPSTVSTHLKILKQAGIIYSKTIKKFVYYEVNGDAISGLSSFLMEYITKE